METDQNTLDEQETKAKRICLSGDIASSSTQTFPSPSEAVSIDSSNEFLSILLIYAILFCFLGDL